MSKVYFLILPFLALALMVAAQKEPNYDESEVPAYVLPDPLVAEDGKPISDANEWYSLRGPELLGLFEEHVYGKVPENNIKVKYEVIASNDHALNGLASSKQIRISFYKRDLEHSMLLLIFRPNNMEVPVPVFLGLNFYGNHTVTDDGSVIISESWVRNNTEFGISNNRATEASRGVRASRWPVEMIVKRGYALATVYYGDIDPDYDDGFSNGIHALFRRENEPRPDEWGSIATWAWGLSRALDYLETDPEIDHTRTAVIGHSRLGKTALWAGARDQRFAMVISNNSGCGGAALSRREFGETVALINKNFPHWFCDQFNRYSDNVRECPVDQHQLISLIAPRPVYVASAEEDLWADPRGEFLSCLHAHPVYVLLGTGGLHARGIPVVNEPVKTGSIGYHIRGGEHGITGYDWKQYLDFADLHFRDR